MIFITIFSYYIYFFLPEVLLSFFPSIVSRAENTHWPRVPPIFLSQTVRSGGRAATVYLYLMSPETLSQQRAAPEDA